MTIWIISDTHFGHENIIGYCCRPFKNAKEMDQEIADRWNALVKPSDHIYHLGDVAMKTTDLQTVKRLNGRKRLVFGNHDIFEYKKYAAVGFEKMMGMRVLDELLLTHVPVHPSQLGRRFKANVHGHIHNNEGMLGRYINVSVEATGV